jgi:aryl-alcohol dehydrogenase-like predicted oxidoreductase
MQQRTIGKTGQSLSEIGYGAWGIGGGWGKQDDTEALRCLKRSVDLGVTFFDTAMGYGNGHSEQLLGKALGPVRAKVAIATKISPKTKRWPVLPRDPIAETFPTDWIIECTERSLKNLGTDYIDIQQLHAWTPGYVECEQWKAAAEKLKQAGKIKAFGVSANDWDPYGTASFAESGLCDSIQVIYNIFEQRPAEKLFPAAQKSGTGIIVRVPFEEGMLTGKFEPGHKFDEGDWRARWLTPERLKESSRRVEKLKDYLAPDRPSLTALALKFCLSHPAVTTVIPGMRRISHVEQNVKASDGKLLTAEEIAELKKHAFVHGWPYPWAQK